jgi:hypothetical protein
MVLDKKLSCFVWFTTISLTPRTSVSAWLAWTFDRQRFEPTPRVSVTVPLIPPLRAAHFSGAHYHRMSSQSAASAVWYLFPSNLWIIEWLRHFPVRYLSSHQVKYLSTYIYGYYFRE